MHLLNGTLLQGGKYRIIRYISSGGFGCTYEAEHVMLGERVAIKEFFVKDFCNRDEATAHVTIGTQSKLGLVEKLKGKFVEEAKMLYRMQHPGIVHVSDIFEENCTAYYVMNYIAGSSLSEIVAAEVRLPAPRALKYIRQIAEALKYVHEHDCLHLDIKPGNIMVDNEDNAILIDFGASKQYDEVDGENTSTLLGMTPGYAPLEQIGNDVVKFTPATDIYSLGATLYKLLTGITPPSANLLASGEELGAFPERISETVRETVIKSMEINKNRRPQNIAEFLKLLDGKVNDHKLSPSAPLHDNNDVLNIKNQEETQIIKEVINEKEDISKAENSELHSGERHPIVNITLALLAFVSLAAIIYLIYVIAYFYKEYGLTHFGWEESIFLMCIAALIGLIQIFRNKLKGFWLIVICTPILYIPGIFEYKNSDLYCLLTYILPMIIGFVIALIALYGALQMKNEGKNAWSLMEPAPVWMKKVSWIAWILLGIAMFAILP